MKSVQKLKGKRVLVLGGAGFIGTHLIQRLLTREDVASIVLVDSLHSALGSSTENIRPFLKRINFIQGDMGDKKLMDKLVREADVIFNCAGQTSHSFSLEDPILDTLINCLGNLTLLTAIKDAKVKPTVVFLSSSTLVGKAQREIIDETHPEEPLEIYSANKGVAEKYYRIFNRVYGIPTVGVRLANVYGPFGRAKPSFGFMNYFINLAKEGKPITIYGDGGQLRNVTYVEDVVEAIIRAAGEAKLHGGSFFVTHHDHYTIKEIAEEMVRVFEGGSVVHVPWPDERKQIEIDAVRFSAERFHGHTGWKAEHSLREGLEKTKKIIIDPRLFYGDGDY